MIDNPFYLLSIAASTLLAFFTATFVVEVCVKFMNVKNYRARFALRLLPFFCMMTDRLFTSLSLGNWFNPLCCASCVQKFILLFFYPDLQDHLAQNETSLIRYLAQEYSHTFFSTVFTAFCLISIFMGLRTLFQAFLVNRSLKKLSLQGQLCTRTIHNSQLKTYLNKFGVKILVSDEVLIPMVSCTKEIFLPKEIVETYPQNEFEAILAHEMEHVRWQDPLAKLVLRTVSAIFWWIPSNKWISQLEQDQEMSCDQISAKYELENEALASALVKLTIHLRHQPHASVCYFGTKPNRTKTRLQAILGLNNDNSNRISLLYGLGVSVAALFLILCFSW